MEMCIALYDWQFLVSQECSVHVISPPPMPAMSVSPRPSLSHSLTLPPLITHQTSHLKTPPLTLLIHTSATSVRVNLSCAAWGQLQINLSEVIIRIKNTFSSFAVKHFLTTHFIVICTHGTTQSRYVCESFERLFEMWLFHTRLSAAHRFILTKD